MVHALDVIHQVLKPHGLLLDLRPAAEHRRAGILEGDQFREIGRLEEVLDEDRAANTAIHTVIAHGLYRRIQQRKFQVNRYFDTFESFKDWYEKFSRDKPCKFNPRLVERVKASVLTLPAGLSFVVTGPIILNVLRKI